MLLKIKLRRDGLDKYMISYDRKYMVRGDGLTETECCSKLLPKFSDFMKLPVKFGTALGIQHHVLGSYLPERLDMLEQAHQGHKDIQEAGTLDKSREDEIAGPVQWWEE
ncbi:hypothetical protein DUI87_16478 [Hirundo rustica rustica]|uniref:Uncharacterized protein n=1 Tax=Hirundo rustica rustica TaxID=333673 RepID=A0A3M0K1C8_HIRRU|nr:hypothetical protein DUI87_16478 [Hirundo rustica rustica]